MRAQAVTGALDLDHDGMVQQAIEERRCHHRIPEHLAPFSKAAVGCEDHRSLFVSCVDQLEEEVGVQADEMISLGEFYPSCGYCNEIIYLYAAKGLHETRQHLDEDEFVTVQTAPLQSVVQQALSGELQDGKTISAVLRLNALHTAGKF